MAGRRDRAISAAEYGGVEEASGRMDCGRRVYVVILVIPKT